MQHEFRMELSVVSPNFPGIDDLKARRGKWACISRGDNHPVGSSRCSCIPEATLSGSISVITVLIRLLPRDRPIAQYCINPPRLEKRSGHLPGIDYIDIQSLKICYIACCK